MSKIATNIDFFQKVGKTNDNRIIYQMEQDGKIAKFTLPAEQEDSFDKANNEISNSLNKDFTKLNSKKGQFIGVVSTILGAGLGYILSRNKKPLVVAITTGLTGLTAGTVALLAFFTPTIKHLKAGMSTVNNFDLKEYKD